MRQGTIQESVHPPVNSARQCPCAPGHQRPPGSELQRLAVFPKLGFESVELFLKTRWQCLLAHAVFSCEEIFLFACFPFGKEYCRLLLLLRRLVIHALHTFEAR